MSDIVGPEAHEHEFPWQGAAEGEFPWQLSQPPAGEPSQQPGEFPWQPSGD